MRDWLAWSALLLFALVLIVGGFQGAIGKLVACLLVPDQIVMDTSF